MQTVLVVSDDQNACTLLRTVLEAECFRVICASGPEILPVATAKLANLVLLAMDPPGMNGLRIIRHLRGERSTAFIPIIIFADTIPEMDLILSLDPDADDFIIQAFRPRELISRVRIVLRRSVADRRSEPRRRIGPLTIDASAHSVTYRDQPITITDTEFRILDLLAKNAGMVISREQIIQASRKSGDPVLARSVDVHIRSLRKKLKGGGDLIMTIRAAGYRLKGADEVPKLD